ncbi:MAG: hypothetical protein HY718_15980 [Planctomycetes bacterium]|nr:hypothetical protein [Planctomycetota bacterium]
MRTELIDRKPSATADTGVQERVREALAREPHKMTSQLARELNVAEVHVIRALPAEQVTELDASQWQDLVRQFERFGKTHVVVNSAGATLECHGEFGKFSNWGGYLNVQTPSLDMHIREEAVAAVFAVTKPSHMDGVKVLSFQFYDRQGASVFKVFLSFGGKEVPAERRAMFEELRQAFAGGGVSE